MKKMVIKGKENILASLKEQEEKKKIAESLKKKLNSEKKKTKKRKRSRSSSSHSSSFSDESWLSSSSSPTSSSLSFQSSRSRSSSSYSSEWESEPKKKIEKLPTYLYQFGYANNNKFILFFSLLFNYSFSQIKQMMMQNKNHINYEIAINNVVPIYLFCGKR